MAPLPPGRGTARRSRRSRDELRTRLLAAARELLAVRGNARATTHEIARRAGVVEPTLFRHFGSKAGLLEAVLIESSGDLLDAMSGSLERDFEQMPWPHCARQWVAMTCDWLEANRETLASLLATPDARTAPARRLPRLLHGLFLRLQTLAQSGQSDGIGADPQAFAANMLRIRLTFGLIISSVLLEDWLFATPQQRPSRERLLEVLTRFIVGGWARAAPRPAGASRRARRPRSR